MEKIKHLSAMAWPETGLHDFSSLRLECKYCKQGGLKNNRYIYVHAYIYTYIYVYMHIHALGHIFLMCTH